MLFLEIHWDIIGIAFVLVLLLVVINIRRVPEKQAWIIEISGTYRRTLHSGIRFILFAAERIAHKVDLNDQSAEIYLQGMHSRDKKAFDCKVNFIYNVCDPRLFAYSKFKWEELLSQSIEQITDEFDYTELLLERNCFTNDAYRIINEKCVVFGINLSKISIYIE